MAESKGCVSVCEMVCVMVCVGEAEPSILPANSPAEIHVGRTSSTQFGSHKL